MRYVVLMFSNPAHTKAMSKDDLAEILRKHEVLRDELNRSGELLNGAGLAYPDEATVLRWDAGAVDDPPTAESRR